MWNINRSYDRLRLAMVGSCWPINYFDSINDIYLRQNLQCILKETQEDLDNLANLLENLDVTVLRPDISSIVNNFAHPPMCAGDHMAMINDTLYETLSDSADPKKKIFYELYRDFLSLAHQCANVTFTANLSICQAMHMILEDRVIYTKNPTLSHHEAQHWWDSHYPTLPAYRFYDDCHLDGWMCCVSPSVALVREDDRRPEFLSMFLNKILPDVNCFILDNPRKILEPHIYSYQHFYEHNQSRETSWAVPQCYWSDNLKNFVNTYLIDWTGNSQETVFEVNSIVIDQHNVIMTGCSDRTRTLLHENDVQIHTVPWRHGLFWDAGINCVTFALHREKE